MLDRFRSHAAAALKSFVYPAGNRNGSTATGFLAGLWGLGLLPPSRYNYRLEAGNLWDSGPVRSGIKWLCRTWPEAPLVVYRPDGEGESKKVPMHPLLDLLARPNSQQPGAALWAGTILSWVVDGNAYWYLEKNTFGQVVQIKYVPHFQIEPFGDPTGRELIGGYLYRVNGNDYPFPVEDVLHFTNGIDPSNTKKGLSDLGAELRAICTDNESQNYAATLLRNFGVPGAIISPKGDAMISPEAADQIKGMWRDRFTGDGRGEPLASPLPIEVTNPGFSPEQLALDKLASLGIPRICAAMGLDPLMLGLPSDSKTYSNVEQAREAAYENTLIPLQRTLDDMITAKLMPMIRGAGQFDRLGRDYTQVRCLADDADKLYERLSKAVGGPWLSPDEAREFIGKAPIDGGEALYPASGGGGLGMNDPADPGNEKPPREEPPPKDAKALWAERVRQRRLDAERAA